MKAPRIYINGHFRDQPAAGVHRYAHEIVNRFNAQGVPYRFVNAPRGITSPALRQLWLQGGMPFKIPSNALLWSPTNIGPVFCKNQVLTLHDISDQLHPAWFDKKYVRWRQYVLPALLNRVRRIITVSEFSRDTIAEHYPQARGKMDVIYNGVRTDHFYARSKAEQRKVRSHFDIQSPFVLTVGSLDPRKNTAGLLQAWRRLPAALRNTYDLVIAGESNPKFSFKFDRTALDENIRFIGFVRDEQLPALYSAATAFVYPSLFEGFGLPVLEAMACGTPVLTSNGSALQEITGDYGLTVDPRRTSSLTAGLENLMQTPSLREQLRERAKPYAQSFSWDESARKTKAVLKKSMC